MTHTIILDKSDICNLVARGFDVKPEKVLFYLENEEVGYGPNEETVKVPKIKITLDNLGLSWEKEE